VSASDLVDCRSENWLLRKKLRECEVTIENLEQLVSTLVEKQHQILSDMFILRTENHELQSECHLQREYHSMERNALLKQLNDAQALYQNRVTTLVSLSTGLGTCKCRRNVAVPPQESRESPMNSDSSFVATSEEDQCESNNEEDNEEDLSTADSLAPSSECSSPSPTCSESEEEDTDLEEDQSAEEDSSNSNSETD
ncbi:hypothetical protein KR054_003978, partial [Drosophila jambulina]